MAAAVALAPDAAACGSTTPGWVRGKQPELQRSRIHSLEPSRAVLEQRWVEGCRNGAQLGRDLRDAGFKGGMRVVTKWASRQRRAAPEQQPGPATTSAVRCPIRPTAYPARRVARMLTANPVRLAEPERAYVIRLLALSLSLAMVHALVQRLGVLVRAAPQTRSPTGWPKPRTATCTALPQAYVRTSRLSVQP